METDTSPNRSLVGTTLDNRYEIQSIIGQGGMSTVYKARHLFLNKDVAIKVMQEHLSANSESKRRFQREAEASAMLSHPNIITVKDFGMSDTGQPYMVMDYLPGQSLADLLRQRYRLSPAESISIFVQVCAALAHAHEKGVLHRDLKPSNIMLYRNESDNSLQVKVVDLGLARSLDKARHQTRLTAAGELVGSPFYMSPEQIRDENLDARSDIYSMGCLMFETLTGTRPFNDNNAITVLSMHLYEEPPHFSKVAPELRCPRRLEAIVMKCLEKTQNKRFQNFNELNSDLRKVDPTNVEPPKETPDRARESRNIDDAEVLVAQAAERSGGTVDLRSQYTLKLQQPGFAKKRTFLDWVRQIGGPVIYAQVKRMISMFEGKGANARKQKVLGTRILVAALGDSKELISAAEDDAAKYRVYYDRVDLRKSMTAQEFIVLLSTDKYHIVHLLGKYDENGTFNDSTGFALRFSDLKRACDFAGALLVWVASNNDPGPMRPHMNPEAPTFHLIMTVQRGSNFPKFLSSLLSRMTRGEDLSDAWEVHVPYLQYKGDKTECKFVHGVADVAFYP